MKTLRWPFRPLARKRGAARPDAQPRTALSQYQRLECLGLWRATPEDQRREVILRVGEATLVLLDPRNETALSHWSLPATLRINPGQEPAVFAPGLDAEESVEITDEAMRAALKTVQSAVKAQTPHPGRLRGVLIGGAIALIAAVSVLVLPGLLVSHTASMVPAPKRAEIGMLALDDVMRLTGAPCAGELGLPPLARLAERVFGPEDTPILYILPEGLQRPAHLPGGAILLPRSLIEEDSPDALAGAALAEGLAAELQDPMRDILDHAGVRATFGLLTSGEFSADALSGYGEAFLRNPDANIAVNTLATRFRDAQVPLSPYARWLNPAEPRLSALLAADPYKGLIPSPLLPDDDWIALQSVCSQS